MIHAVDYLALFFLLVVLPLHSVREYRRYVARIESGEPPDRPALYRRTIASMWLMLAVLAATWWLLGRPAELLGFTAPAGTGFWIATAVILAGTMYLFAAWQKCRQLDAAGRKENRAALGTLAHFLPQDDRDLRLFSGLSVTAGVVEEIIYRGYLIWCLALMMPLWVAIVVSSLVFGLAHSYQGVQGMLKTGLAGVVLALIYVGSGSIWLAIIAHMLLDLLQGFAIRELYREPSEDLPVQQPGTQ